MKKFILSILCCIALPLFLSAQETAQVFTYKIGTAEISRLNEVLRDGSSTILIGATPEMKQETIPNGTFPNAVNAFFIRTPEKNILVDAGYGTHLFDHLKTLGVSAEQIDIVLITHMHGDHIGGMLREDKRSFPHAEIYIAQPEYDYWTSEAEMNKQPENRRGGFLNAQKMIDAYKGQIHLFQPQEIGTNTQTILPGIQGIAAYGHTPGHSGFLLKSTNQQLLIWGDLTHAMAIQMPYPDVAVTYDVDPETAVVYRKKILEFVTKNKIPVAGMHIPETGMGQITTHAPNSYIFTSFK
ncbi:MBL fold metallo-hydrolase [Parabacteroides sp. PF5-9]|uniref:MBL fold metallo-hydrolase n=1 Tax=Parabacteroides sp. PF5-9 TaxID=1742404 RepID=UPI0024747E88|nr:MBL fold metallo-hydrolase [Parabacteroides sp. PF5-9]MDH6358340.1 glyoxylase-like metal-dependent hydrolase (beta-lactamase superfamily II) [Parabacteroides sp. PF5-9]